MLRNQFNTIVGSTGPTGDDAMSVKQGVLLEQQNILSFSFVWVTSASLPLVPVSSGGEEEAAVSEYILQDDAVAQWAESVWDASLNTSCFTVWRTGKSHKKKAYSIMI